MLVNLNFSGVFTRALSVNLKVDLMPDTKCMRIFLEFQAVNTIRSSTVCARQLACVVVL